MPFVSIQTNQNLEQSNRQAVLNKLSAFTADLLSKPESKVMAHIEAGAGMLFAGSDEPAAFVRLKSIGLPRDKCSEYADKISDFLERELSISKSRIFIDLTDIDRSLFALNGKTFA
jgi:phenylpyruvate tautomerase PptA (4-oxalocrotonate tautomerase family)